MEAPVWQAALLSPDPSEVMAAVDSCLAEAPDRAHLPVVLAALAALPIPNPRHDPPPPVALRLLDLLIHAVHSLPPGTARDNLILNARAAQADQRRHDVFSAHVSLLDDFRESGGISLEAFRDAWVTFPVLRQGGALTEYLLRQGIQLPLPLLLSLGRPRRELHAPYARHLLNGNQGPEILALYCEGDLLDLSGTGLLEWPDAASGLHGIRRLDLRGTRIRRIPASFRAALVSVEGRKSTEMALRMQVVEDGACGGPFEQEMQARHGMALFRRGKRAEALRHFKLGLGQAGLLKAKGRVPCGLEAVLACAAEAGDWGLCLEVIALARPNPNPHPPYRGRTMRRDKTVAEYWPSFHASSFHAVMAGKIGAWDAAVQVYMKDSDPFTLETWWSWHRHFRRLLELGMEDQLAVLLREARKWCKRLELNLWDWLWALRFMEAKGQPQAAIRIFCLADPLPADPDAQHIHWPRLLRNARAYLHCMRAQGEEATARMYASRLPAYARKAEKEAGQPYASVFMMEFAQQLRALAAEYSSQ